MSEFETRLVLRDDENDKPFLFSPFEAVPIAQNLLGVMILVGLAWLLGEGRLSVPLKHRLTVIGSGLSVQLVLALLLLKLPGTQEVFMWLNGAVAALQAATAAGTSFVFGYLGGGTLPFEETKPGASFVLAFRALPLILVIGALSSLLFYWRVLPVIVGAVSWCLQKVMGIGGALGVGAAANVFVGMVEAPLLIRPYLARLTRSELFAVMVCGMATIAGTMMVLYATVLEGVVPHAIGHLLTASLINAPAAIMVARLMVPETAPPTVGTLDPALRPASTMDAITRGTLDGVGLLINVIAMLVVLVALVHLANLVLGLLPDLAGAPLTLQRLLGVALAPLAWLTGIPWSEAPDAGALLGTKIVLNEFIAYLDFAVLPTETFEPRSRIIMTYALCGFANLGSLGILIGGLTTMVPERRREIIGLGLKSILAGTLTTCLTATIVGMLH